MIINPQLVKSVLDAWIGDQEHPLKDRENREYPDEEYFGKILDIAFCASLLTEEGKPIKGSLTLLSPDELLKNEIPKRRETQLVVSFESPRELDVELVSKLSSATDAGTASLLVGLFEGICKVWGIIYYNRFSHSLMEISVGIPEGRHFPPDSLIIEIVGAGSLKIMRAECVIGRIERGEFRPAVPTPLSYRAMGPILGNLFGIKTAHGRFISENDGYRHGVCHACLRYLFSRIDIQGGGSTIIFINNKFLDIAYSNVKFPWKCSGDLEINVLMDSRVNYDKKIRDRFQYNQIVTIKIDQLLRERLDGIVRLASLDGATLLSQNFELIGFGAKLQAPEYFGEVQEGPDGFGNMGRAMDFSRLGTRHNSALRFVASVPGSVAFVASEDGPIRGLARVSDEIVCCWPDCRISMFG